MQQRLYRDLSQPGEVHLEFKNLRRLFADIDNFVFSSLGLPELACKTYAPLGEEICTYNSILYASICTNNSEF